MSDPLLELRRGESKEWSFTASQGAEPVDLTNASLTFTLRETFADKFATLQKTVGNGITVTDDTAGKFILALEPEDTKNIPIRADKRIFVWDVWGVLASGKEKSVARGTLELSPEVTR